MVRPTNLDFGQNARSDVFIIDPDGNLVRRVTEALDNFDGYPVWVGEDRILFQTGGAALYGSRLDEELDVMIQASTDPAEPPTATGIAAGDIGNPAVVAGPVEVLVAEADVELPR